MGRKWMWVLAGMCAVMMLVSGTSGYAEELKPGMKAPDWSFKDADGKPFTMESWAGKVLLINYVNPDYSDANNKLNDAMKKAKKDGLLKDATYKGIGIADCKATWKPNVLIRVIAAHKAKKYKTTILFDYDATLRHAWGLSKEANVILLDKNRVVKAIVRGPVPDSEVASLVKMAIDLQNK